MTEHWQPPHHKHNRLAGYDYSQSGAYAFTVVVHERLSCLGEISDYTFVPGPAAEIVQKAWEGLPGRFPTIMLDAFVVMPNHVHGIVFLGVNSPAIRETPVASPFMAIPIADSSFPLPKNRTLRPPSRGRLMPALGEVVRSLKASSTTRIRKACLPAFKWQDGYWDRIIRNEAELERYRGYIATNPERWTLDREYADQ